MCLRFLFLALTSPLLSVAQQAIYPLTGTLFDEQVHRVDIQIAPDSLSLLWSSAERWTNREFMCTVVYDQADTLPQVAIRLRGNTSRNAPAGKLSYRLDFNHWQPGQTLQGIRNIALNGSRNDPSMAREITAAYLMDKAGVHVPRCNPAAVYINGQYQGLRILAEYADELFVKTRFGSNPVGPLFKCTWPADLAWEGSQEQTYKDIVNPSPLNERAYELKTLLAQDDYSGLVDLIQFINQTSAQQFKSGIESRFNVQGYLKSLAMEILIGHWDNYYYNKNNFYLYYVPQFNRWEYFPYDMDNTFGIHWNVCPDVDDRDIHDWGSNNAEAPLTNKLLAIPEFRADFEGYVEQFLGSVFNSTHLFPRLDSLRNRLQPFIAQDPNYNGSSGYLGDEQRWSQNFSTNSDIWAVKPYIGSRYSSAMSQLQGLGFTEPSALGWGPNPWFGMLHFSEQLMGKILCITDLQGRAWYSGAILQPELNLKAVPPGIYFLNWAGSKPERLVLMPRE